ncbi:SOS response associated peptidase (SRAP) [Pontibacter ummariensis]|uniref:Abasic site processing protein n=1 Tax=Pontibacter ummariensis TaxID=1610492 RepID=A0A239L484_9BACT|nr:SOS response-associated peptidase family protein [Pontibacter ummariensis]PRY04600.1 SOS response associated peptidase (SRAP) [Pontibacter ummariensis]SNT24354.1 SOS response associated peptidase (SRAP) [Pontibacter ummariensis]
MCGRYSIISKNKEGKGSVRAARLLKQQQVQERYNVAPSQSLPVITGEEPDRLQFFTWGLLPHWAKENSYKRKIINARAESLTEKPLYKGLVNRKRCLVPADSFTSGAIPQPARHPIAFY